MTRITLDLAPRLEYLHLMATQALSTIDLDTNLTAVTYAPRDSSTIEVRVSDGGARIYRHTKVFPRTRAGWSGANQLVRRVNASGVTLRHVATSEHWRRTGRMSGSVQVNRKTASNFTVREYSDGRKVVTYDLVGPVTPSWGTTPKPGAMWDFGTQYDYSGRTIGEIKASVELASAEIYDCGSFELWPYQDMELIAALRG